MGERFRARSIDFASIIKDVLRQWWGIILFTVSCTLLTATIAEIQYIPLYFYCRSPSWRLFNEKN